MIQRKLICGSAVVVAFCCMLFSMMANIAAAVPQSSVAVDWTAVETSPSPQVLDGKIGRCICNKHAEGCDPNCHCDTQCSDVVKENGFTDAKKETTSWRTFVKCTEETYGTHVKWTRSEEYQDARIPGQDAVCIEYNNFDNDIALTYFVPESLTSTEIPPAPHTADWWTAPQHEAGYKAGDRVATFYATVINGQHRKVKKESGFLTIPTPGLGGQCKNDRTVEFMKPIDATRCNLQGTVEQLCALGGTDRYLSMAIAGPAHSSTLVPMIVNLFDADTGKLIQTIDPTASFPGATQAPSARRMQELASTDDSSSYRRQTAFVPGNVTSGVNPICRQFVVAASIGIGYTYTGSAPNGKIFNASADVYVRDISAAPTVQLRVEREFVVKFFDKDGSQPSLRSGTPGYVAGDKVNAGTRLATEAATAVSPRLFGLTVPQSRICSNNKAQPVKFLHNVIDSGCGVALTEEEVRGLCGQSDGSIPLLHSVLKSTELIRSPLATTNISDIVNRLGRTADADPNNHLEWVEVQGYPLQGATSIWDEDLRRCTDIVTGLHYTIAVGRAGVEYNPQDVIVGAKVEPIIGNWNFRNDTMDTGTSMMYFTFKVSFVRTADATKTRRVVPPRVLPEVDDDVFYPFRYPRARGEEED